MRTKGHFYMEGLLKKLIICYMKLLRVPFRASKKKYHDFLLTEICSALTDEKFDITYRLSPKDPLEIPVLQRRRMDNRFAIVMQGPICVKEDFTVRTVKYYRDIYKEAVIIVSTWEGESPQAIKTLEDMGAVLVRSKLPEKSGILNLNYQIVSTLAGIQKAKELHIRYVAKTRTDQRLGRPFIFEYLLNLLNHFPGGDPHLQKSRIISLSMNYGNLFTPYFMSDFFYFGQVGDIEKLYLCPLDTRDFYPLDPDATCREVAKRMYPPEIYIFKHYVVDYLKGNGNDTVKAYWDILKHYFICVDIKTVNLVFPKYASHFRDHWMYGDYNMNDRPERMRTMNFDFINWFNLYSGTLKYDAVYEKFADVRF